MPEYSLAQLENSAITPGTISPIARVTDQPALTDNVHNRVGTTDGNYADYAELPFDVVTEWSLALYGAYGLCSSYNGALCSWSLIGT